MWVLQVIGTGVPLSDDIVVKKATYFREQVGISELELKCSKGWWNKVKLRRNLQLYRIYGEIGSVDLSHFSGEIEILKKKLQNYCKRDIYNFDETALFYRLLPNKTLASKAVSGQKSSKERIHLKA